MLSSHYTMVLTHGSIFNMSQAGVQPLCHLCAVQNLPDNSVIIFFIHHTKSYGKPLEKCTYVIKTLAMLPHISKIGDTTREASFNATGSIMLLIHAVLMAVRS